MSDLPQPRPQRFSFDSECGSLLDVNEEIGEHHLEEALRNMNENGELEEFLRVHTINLNQIQDDMTANYGKTSDACHVQLKARARRHSIGTAEELIRCPFPGCIKIFNRAYNFKSHFKIHTGDRPFKCNDCDLSFARCHDLRRHEKIHKKGNQNSNKCEFCNRLFSRPDALNRHIKLNTCQSLLYKREE